MLWEIAGLALMSLVWLACACAAIVCGDGAVPEPAAEREGE